MARSDSKTRIILIGCGKAKVDHAAPAGDLYNGSLFTSRRRYAEQSGDRWFVISAKYGLLDPCTIVQPYDQRVDEMSQVDQAAWAIGVASQILMELPDHVTLRNIHVEIHASEAYADRLRDVVIAAGMCASWPTQGMSQGALMAFYAKGAK